MRFDDTTEDHIRVGTKALILEDLCETSIILAVLSFFYTLFRAVSF